LFRSKRSKTIEKKRKGKKTESTSKTLTPTKPSLLATVTVYEKSAVSELYEGPWRRIEELKTNYEKVDKLHYKIPDLLNELRGLQNAMWKNKQIVLRQTKRRLISERKDQPMQEKLRLSAEVYSKIKTDEDEYKILSEENEIAIFPIGQWEHAGETFGSFMSALRTEKIQELFPHCWKILQLWDRPPEDFAEDAKVQETKV